MRNHIQMINTEIFPAQLEKFTDVKFVRFLCLAIVPILLSVATIAMAEIRFIKPSAEIAVRRGQGTEYKIIAVVGDGTKVELLEENDDYAKIRLDDEKEGWVLKRFLSEEPPLTEVVARLRFENEEARQREMENAQKLEELTSTLARTENDLDSVNTEKNRLATAYRNLQKDTEDVIQIKENLENTQKSNQLLTSEMATIKQENEHLKKENSINWFLAGGGVLLLGMIIGRLSSRSRKRKPSLLQ